jgi:hypothetical protein
MGDETGEKGQGIPVGWKRAAPKLRSRVGVGDEGVGMIEGHDDHDQAAKGVERF